MTFISPRRREGAATESVLAVDIGGTKLAAASRRPSAGSWAGPLRRPLPPAKPRPSGLPSRRCVRSRPPSPAAGVWHRIGRTHVGRRRAGLAAQHPGLAGLSPPRPPGRADRPAHLDRQRRQSLGPGRRLGGRSGRACATTSRWSYPPESVAASSSTADCSMGTTATPVTSVMSWSSPTGRRMRRAEGRGCLEAEASGTAIAAITGRAAAGPARKSWPAPGRWSVGRWRRWPTCSTCSWRRSAARWRSASVSRSLPRPGTSWRPGPACSSRADCRIVPGRLGAAGPADRGRGGRMAGLRRRRSAAVTAADGGIDRAGPRAPAGTLARPGWRCRPCWPWPSGPGCGRAWPAWRHPAGGGEWPPSPLPPPDYVHFRTQTMYGDDGRLDSARPHRLPRMVSPYGVAGAVTSAVRWRTIREEGADPAAAHRRPPGR